MQQGLSEANWQASRSDGRGERRLSPRKAWPQPCSQDVSPIKWDNVILYGQYVLDRARVR